MDKLRVCVLGGTGLVGQHMIKMLAEHPWFEIDMITASKKSAGKKYEEACKWLLDGEIPENVREITVVNTDLENISKNKPDFLLSALPSDVAEEIEIKLAKVGHKVVSNSSPMRMDEDIPLLNPEVNANHTELIDFQKETRKWEGFIVKAPNCSTTILTLTLKPILDEYGIKAISVVTMQSVSGAGYAGVPSMAIIDNIIPYITKEENKIETETRKVLGKLKENKIKPINAFISATCTRVPVLYGHMEVVSIKTKEECEPKDAIKCMEKFRGKIQKMKLPTCPEKPIIVRKEEDRPQPRLDRYEGKGMSVVVGRIRKCQTMKGIKYIALGNNLIRGAAGVSILIAELLHKTNHI